MFELINTRNNADQTALSRLVDRRYLPYLVTCIGAGLIAFFVTPYLWEFVLPWRRPVQNWMMANGLGSLAGQYGVINSKLPDALICAIAGALIGLVAHRRWLWLSLAFVLSYELLPSLYYIVSIWGFGRQSLLIALAYSLSMELPPALAAGWIAARYAKRRHARLNARAYCAQCGYDLRGNESGRCSECGKAVPNDWGVTVAEPDQATNGGD